MANESSAAPAVDARAADDIPEAVQWHEGMLLSPQHFQQHSARLEGLIQAAALALNPFAWGLDRLRLDPAALPAGLFRIRQLAAVLPDGARVDYDAAAEDGGEPLELDLAPAARAFPGRGLTVYLALPRRTVSAAHGESARYRSVAGTLVADENTGEGEIDIPRLRPRLRLFAGEAPPPQFTSLPIAKVALHDDAFALTDYVAPTARVGFDSPLLALASSVAQLLRAKALHLAEQVRAPSVAALSPVVWESKRQIQCLVAALPALEALLSTGCAHPFALYLALCGVAGQVTGLASSLQPPLLPAYAHEDPASSFAAVREFVLRAVAEGVADDYLAVPLERRDPGFTVRFDASWGERRLALGIRRPAGATEADMAHWGQQCVIASEEMLPSLREKRVLGLRRRLLPPGDELAAKAGMVLIELVADPAILKPDRPLWVENPGAASTPAEIVLYIKNPDS